MTLRQRVLRAAIATITEVSLLVVVLISAPAMADEGPIYGGHDWYGSIYGMLAIPNMDADSADPGGGAAVSAGFRFNRWFAGEIGAEWLHEISYDRGSGPLTCSTRSGGADSFTAWQVTGGGRMYFTDSLIQPYLLAHGGFMQTRDHGGGRSCTSSGFIARLGGGVEVFVTNGLAVSLLGAYVLPTTGNAKDHDYVSIGFGITWY
jgi:hypothetical protein